MSAYIGSSKNLKDLKDTSTFFSFHLWCLADLTSPPQTIPFTFSSLVPFGYRWLSS